MRARLVRVERRLMTAEYLLDSVNMHVRQINCRDVKPRALARYTKALTEVKTAIQLLRNELGVKHPTLFAGKQGAGSGFVQRRKAWGSAVPHRWKKDCDEERELNELRSSALSSEKDGPIPRSVELGLSASCWHCDAIFTKLDYCGTCGFFRCPYCRKCACDLPPETRRILEKTVRAMAQREVKR